MCHCLEVAILLLCSKSGGWIEFGFSRNPFFEAVIAMFAVAGFLGTRGSFMLDFVFLAMFAVVPIMGISIYLVKYRRQFQLHRRIQISLGLILLLAVAAFEVDMRINGWKHLAEPSAYWVDGAWNDWIDYGLAIHLLFAVPTPIIWCVVIVKAMRRFSNPPEPN